MSRKAALPDIDTSQPDVFETDVGVDEVPQQTSVADEFKKRDHDGTKEGPIDNSSVKLNQAFDKFNGKKFEVGAKDAYGRLARRSEYEILAKNNKLKTVDDEPDETPFQKYQRLQVEVSQLVKEINDLAMIEENKKQQNPTVAFSAYDDIDLKEVTDKLQGLQGKLNELQSKESAQLFINPNYELEKTLKVKSQDEITKKILHQVRTASAAETKQATSSSSDKGVVYELYYSPEQTKQEQLAKVAEMEKRIHQVESLLGNKVMMPGNSAEDIVSVVLDLKHKLSLLSDDSLSTISTKAQAASKELDVVLQKQNSTSAVSSDDLKKINELHSLISGVDAAIEELPIIVNRLTALKTLHEESAVINQNLQRVDQEQFEITNLLKNHNTTLAQVEENFTKNMTTIQNNFNLIDKRIADLQSKMKKLK
jgi:dynactin-2